MERIFIRSNEYLPTDGTDINWVLRYITAQSDPQSTLGGVVKFELSMSLVLNTQIPIEGVPSTALLKLNQYEIAP